MGKDEKTQLLSPEEGAAVSVTNQEGSSPFLIVCEHASRTIPASLGGLGLDAGAAESHIAWDPGALAVATELSHLLDAPLVAARFSRLAYDCNRPPESPGAMPEKSEIYDIPGNRNLSDADRAQRIAALYEPFRNAVTDTITARILQGNPPVLVTIHSFTPVYFGEKREVELGILHDEDSTLADAMLANTDKTAMLARRNEPYGAADGVTHTLKLHGLANGLPNVMIEVRNDLLATGADRKKVAAELADMLRAALASLETTPVTENTNA